jgi:hypothetical protein
MGALGWRARAGVLLLVGAVAVHQLVYGLAGVRPDEHVHAYLDWLTPAVFALLFAAAAELVLRALGVHRRASGPPPRGRALLPVLSALLVATFASQELAETLLAPGDAHAHALNDLVVGHGLWMVVPVALVVGGVLALALRGAAAVEAWCLRIEQARAAEPIPYVERRRAPLLTARAPRELLGRNLAGRAPPPVVA